MKKNIALVVLNFILLSCSHHMIKDYKMATDDNKREIFRVFHVDTTSIHEYCHNNFLPARYQLPALVRNFWIDIEENTQNKTVVLYLRIAVTDWSRIVEISIDNDTICLNPSLKQYIRKKKEDIHMHIKLIRF